MKKGSLLSGRDDDVDDREGGMVEHVKVPGLFLFHGIPSVWTEKLRQACIFGREKPHRFRGKLSKGKEEKKNVREFLKFLRASFFELSDFHPDSFMVFSYPEGSGFQSHFDSHWWGEDIVSLSIGASSSMEFTWHHSSVCKCVKNPDTCIRNKCGKDCRRRFCNKKHGKNPVIVPLRNGTVVLMRGDARHVWKHAIKNVQGQRYSIVFRNKGNTSGKKRRRSDEKTANNVTKSEPQFWACPVCTLRNKPLWLVCDACGSEKP